MSARQRNSSIDSGSDYCYVNEDAIDSNLKCLICHQPLIDPMAGKRCGHTFCDVCIKDWYNRDTSCPTCRSKTSFEPLTTRIVLSQLNSLLVRCLYCEQITIQRGDWADHIQHRCRQVEVRCKAADLKCSWKGKREEQDQHSNVCPLVKIQPIIEDLRGELRAHALQLQIFMNEVRDQLNYSQETHVSQIQRNRNDSGVYNENKSEKERFEELMNDLKYQWTTVKHRQYCRVCCYEYKDFLKCLVCSRVVGRHNVAIHDNYRRSVENIICTVCAQKYREQ